MKKDLAFSGLEAAIVLIAFVVVAAVFSYVMLGAGFFATQKSQEVTYSGIKQATSNVIIDGSQYGVMNTASDHLQLVTFYLAIPVGGQAQKISDIEYTVTVDNEKMLLSRLVGEESNRFVVVEGGSLPALVNGILLPGNSAKLVLHFGTAAEGVGPSAGGTFTMEVRPKVGAASLLSKQLATGYKGGVIL